MSRIVVLDDNMINMIAAGEVIERPASVVKELLENSIDAGAGRISVEVEEGGKKLIRIVDDGCGMDADDLVTAFEPHATSKIRTSDDLMQISTMGFRGEALASIASVSQVKVVSRTADSIQANTITLDCGQKSEVKPCSGDIGTSIEVRNLFYKLPARRKFMRTTNTEMGHISEGFTRVALANRQLNLSLTHKGRELHQLRANQSPIERIGQLLGRQVAEDLLETQREEKGIFVRAFLGKPAAARTSSKYQYIFLNGRFIRDKFILHAIREAYRGLMESDRHPVVFLYIEMEASQFDVNVHPTKIEVRFDNANLVHSQVLAVLREKLLGSNLDVTGQIPARPVIPIRETKSDIAADARQQRVREAMADFFKQQKSESASQRRFDFPTTKTPSRTQQIPSWEPAPTQPDTEKAWPGQDFIQIHESYILLQTDEGFEVIDQHALHERLIYEKLAARLEAEGLESQRLLIPETLELTDAQQEALQSHASLIERLGISIEPFGPKVVAIQAFPTLLKKVAPTEFVRDTLDLLTEKASQTDAESIVHEILDMAACKAAVKAGQSLSRSEVEQLLADKDKAERSSRCPHGRPTTLRFSLKDLEKQFKRT